MSTQCLVTKLKSAVNDNTLPIYGCCYVVANKWNNSSAIKLSIETTEECKLYLPQGEYFTTDDGVTPYGGVQSNVFTVPANIATRVYTSWIGGVPYLITIEKGSAVKTLRPTDYNTNITFNPDTATYQYLTNIVTLGYNNFMSHTTYTEKSRLLDLFWSTKMRSINFSGHQFSGSIESIVEQLWDLGKRSGAYLGLQSIASASILFHGASSLLVATAAQEFRLTFTSTNVRISIDSGSTIATYDGSTWSYSS